VPAEGSRSKHDVVVGAVATTARGEFGLVTSAGRMFRLSALDLPTLPPTNGAPSHTGGAPLAAYVDLPKGEDPVTILPIGADAPVIALGTATGVVKRVTPEAPKNNDWSVISLKDGDSVVGAGIASSDDLDLVFVTSDAQLLRFAAKSVRPQGRSAGGMAGIKLSAGARAAYFGVVDPNRDGIVVTSAGSSGALPGTEGGSLKVTPYAEYPPKGRATGGVRCHRFLKGEDTLVVAFAGNLPARAAAANGVAIDLPAADGRRDGSGVATTSVIAQVAGPPPTEHYAGAAEEERQ
jgi:DNA gyrase subunit A